jgi:hypothetical protein
MFRFLIPVIVALGSLAAAPSEVFAAPLDYGREIQPIFAENCYDCHGPDQKTRKAGLRLDVPESAMAVLESGKHAIVPGKSDQSEMIRRLFSDDPDEMMPPPDFRKRPSTEAKARLKRWIDEGAEFARHWAFEPVRSPVIPRVKREGWARNEIDHFILAALERSQMEPSPPADANTLVRRLSLDLRGLPPSLEELNAHTAASDDHTYRAAVDTMLGSVHYGEKMAQNWLDLARYGDTNGYHNDSDRAMWLYRDYVINSFNANKPFDRFIVENMAGDLLPNATEETRIASGFNRCVTFNEEGGADPDEFYTTYAVDRANTTGQVFMGLTVGCAQCHDHKYDPISQKEFYQLFAFFNSIDGEIGAGGMSGYHNKPLPPLLTVKTDELKREIAELDRKISKNSRELKAATSRPEFTDITGPLANAATDWAAKIQSNQPSSLEVHAGLQLHLDAANAIVEDGAVSSWQDKSDKQHHAISTGKPALLPDAINGQPAVHLDGKSQFLRTVAGAEALGGNFTMVVVLRFHDMMAHQMPLMWGDESQGKRRALWKTDQNQLSFNGYGADVVGTAKLKVNEPSIAIITQSGNDNSTRFSLNGHAGGEGTVGLSEFVNQKITIGANNAGKELTAADIAEVLVYDRAVTQVEAASIGQWLGAKYGIETAFEPAPREILSIASLPADQRTEAQRRTLFAHFINYVHPESRDLFQKLEQELAKTKSERDRIERGAPTTMVMVEMKERKPAHILMRGDFQQPGEEVLPDVPAIFPRLPADKPRNRLGLAYWLTDPQHPLVARVLVNRIWKQFFGTGLVKTLGDFGTQGERPSHPELLDWLAADFVVSGWDIKRLQRHIVNSATYRQSSRENGRYRERDPGNRLVSKAPRFRLSAEEIRDVALASSGLLHRKIGGSSVMPHQPPGYLSSIGKGWNESTGSALHRRGLYTFWRRTMLYPTFQIFDAPSREFCSVNRPRTNTPLQALVTLNDPTFVEAARAFGDRVFSEKSNVREKLTTAFRLATSRPPTDGELKLLVVTLAEQRAHYRSKPGEATEFLGNADAPPENAADRAAWTALAGILLNLDESITRE